MTPADILDALLKANLASGAAILAVTALRKTARSRFGARLAYGLWLLPVLAGAAVLLPARQQVVVRTAAPMVAAAARIGPSVAAPPAAAAAAAPTGLDGSTLLLALWLAGVVGAALLMTVLQHRFVTRARRGGVGPAVVGLIAPRILVPQDFAERYSPNEQSLVLAHEQAHLARQDCRLNGLAAALQCLNWFNPLMHLAARLMRVDQELACDEAVVSRFPDARRAYAEVLMKAQLAVLPLPLGCYWPSRSQHPLVERIAMLKRPRIGRARWRAGAVALGCLWAGAGVAAWASQPAEVRTEFKAAPIAEGPIEPATSEGKVADAAPSPIAEPPAARSAPASRSPAPTVIAQASAPPLPIAVARPMHVVIQNVVIKGAQRIDQATILSKVGIRPGDTVPVEALNAAQAALVNTGLFSDVSLRSPSVGGSGDLVVSVTENPLIDQVKFEGNTSLKDDQLRAVVRARSGAVGATARINADAGYITDLYRLAGWLNAKVDVKTALKPDNRIDVTFIVNEGAKRRDDDPSSTAFPLRADQIVHDEAHHIDIFKGNVTFNGYLEAVPSWQILCDLLIMPSGPPNEPGVPEAKKITWEGGVLVNHGDDAARADYAYYDFGSKTLTLTGHVAVKKGPWMVRDDKLVVDAKDLFHVGR